MISSLDGSFRCSRRRINGWTSRMPSQVIATKKAQKTSASCPADNRSSQSVTQLGIASPGFTPNDQQGRRWQPARRHRGIRSVSRFAGKESGKSRNYRILVNTELDDQVMEVFVAAVGNAFEPAPCLALVS